MLLQTIPDLLTYISVGNETTHSVTHSKCSLYKGVETYYDFFRNEFLPTEQLGTPVAAFLTLNAFMLYTSSIRMTLTGHVAAVPPLFRTALESACYSFLIKKDPKAESIWLSRHKDEASLVACRKYFGNAVKKVASLIGEYSPSNEKWINEGYQTTIDFGAHPNPKSILEHLSTTDRDDNFYQVDLTGLYGAESFELKHHLIGCLDFGLLIAIIITHSIENPSKPLQDKLQELNDLKESLTTEHFPDCSLPPAF